MFGRLKADDVHSTARLMTIAESGFKSAKSKDKKIVASGATLQAAEASTTTSKKMSDTSDAGQSHAPASHVV